MELLPETCNKWKDGKKILDSFGRGPVGCAASVVALHGHVGQ